MIICGDAWCELGKLDSGIVQTCITSPPYWGLRDYGCDGQLGLEPTPEEYIARLVEIFAEVKRVLRDGGTLWLVLGDSYASNTKGDNRTPEELGKSDGLNRAKDPNLSHVFIPKATGIRHVETGLKPKDLCMIPARVALALQADGWWLRSDIVWAKPNPMPESVTDRPTSAHEHIFLLAKGQRYFYDADSIKEPAKATNLHEFTGPSRTVPGQSFQRGTRDKQRGHSRRHAGFNERWDLMSRDEQMQLGANKRNVWTVATKPYPEAHFAVYPPALIEPCVLAGSAEGDTVLDPFMGSGTTGEVALKHRRKFIGIELNPEYVKLAEKRLREVEMVMF